MPLTYHPFSKIFPIIEGREFDDLVADVRANGIRERIVTLDGNILDGRNRHRAGLAAGLIKEDEGPDRERYFAKFVPEVDGDPLAFVISKNIRRRHLNESQRAMVAVKLANLPAHRPAQANKLENLPTSQPQAAEQLNISDRLVRSAKVVQEHGAPELVRAVEQGRLKVSAAAQAARLDLNKQREIAAEAEAGRENVARAAIKKEARNERERELGTRQHKLPGIKAGLILEDYEWDDEVYSRDTGMDRHAANHYPTSESAHTAEEIVARRPIESIVDDDCVLAMWSTIQHLAIALDVMKLRGFTYKSHYVWGKERESGKPSLSLGRWMRGRHEILLIGSRGAPPCPAPGQQWHSLIMAPKGKHSAKPEIFLAMLEEYFPTLVKIELNHRGPPRPGWYAWGYEAENTGIETVATKHSRESRGNGPVLTHKSPLVSLSGNSANSSGSVLPSRPTAPATDSADSPAIEAAMAGAGEFVLGRANRAVLGAGLIEKDGRPDCVLAKIDAAASDPWHIPSFLRRTQPVGGCDDLPSP